MRGRHTLAMLKTMAVEELIASNVDAYVAISSRLLQDQAFYARIKTRIG